MTLPVTADMDPDDSALSSPRSGEDNALVVRIRADDTRDAERAFEALYRKYYAPMVSFGASYVHDVEVARELVSDVFAIIWERRETWDVKVSAATYLYQALRHRAQNHRRNSATELRNTTRSLHDDTRLGIGSMGPAADIAVEQQERTRRLWAAVDQLPDARRTVVRLRWHDQLSFDEIAAVLGTTSAAVQMQLSRALKQLRSILTEE